MAVPRRMRVAGVTRILDDITMIIAAGTIAPTNAKITMLVFPVAAPNNALVTMAATAPKQAPEEIPVLYGSAKGLFMSDCIITPDAASPIPAKMAQSALGMERFQMKRSFHQSWERSGYCTPVIWFQISVYASDKEMFSQTDKESSPTTSTTPMQDTARIVIFLITPRWYLVCISPVADMFDEGEGVSPQF